MTFSTVYFAAKITSNSDKHLFVLS